MIDFADICRGDNEEFITIFTFKVGVCYVLDYGFRILSMGFKLLGKLDLGKLLTDCVATFKRYMH